MGSTHTCPYHDLREVAPEPFIGNMSFHHFNMIFSGTCAAFSSIIILVLMFSHATHLSKPNEQIKIMKICLLLPFYSIISILSIIYPEAYVYLNPWLNFVESIAMGAFFLLLCEFVSDSPSERDMFFAALVIVNKKAQKRGKNGQSGGMPWFRRRWVLIFQYPVVSLLIAISTCITQAAGTYCRYESKLYFAKLWLELAENVSVFLAVTSVIRVWDELRKHLKSYKTLGKVLALKGLVFWMWIASIIFWILSDAHKLNPSSKLTYADLNIGLPNMVTCIIIVPLSIFFPFAYPSRPYYISCHAVPTVNVAEALIGERYHGGFLGWRAWVGSVNPLETWRAIVFGVSIAIEDRQRSQRVERVNLVPSTDVEYSMGYQ